jgi:hypothetical protein
MNNKEHNKVDEEIVEELKSEIKLAYSEILPEHLVDACVKWWEEKLNKALQQKNQQFLDWINKEQSKLTIHCTCGKRLIPSYNGEAECPDQLSDTDMWSDDRWEEWCKKHEELGSQMDLDIWDKLEEAKKLFTK